MARKEFLSMAHYEKGIMGITEEQREYFINKPSNKKEDEQDKDDNSLREGEESD